MLSISSSMVCSESRHNGQTTCSWILRMRPNSLKCFERTSSKVSHISKAYNWPGKNTVVHCPSIATIMNSMKGNMHRENPVHIHGCKTNWLIYVFPGGTCIQLNVFTVIINAKGKAEVTLLTEISPEWSVASLYIIY